MPRHRRVGADDNSNRRNRLESPSSDEQGSGAEDIVRQREREARSVQLRRLDQQRRLIEIEMQDLENQRSNIESQRNEEIRRQTRYLNDALTNIGAYYDGQISRIEEAMAQAGSRNPAQVQAEENRHNTMVQERDTHLPNIRMAIQAIEDGIHQRYRPEINSINASLQQLRRNRQGVSEHITAIRIVEEAAVVREAQREADIRAAFGERTPSPPQNDPLRWRS
jgi:hypothetical protein